MHTNNPPRSETLGRGKRGVRSAQPLARPADRAKANTRTRSALLAAAFALVGFVTAMFAAVPAQAGAGWGDTTNPTPDPAISAPNPATPGAFLVRTYYANSPQGMQLDALTGLPTRDTGTALRKFVDALPGLGAAAFTGVSGNLTDGTYIPVAVGDTATYPGSVYYEVAVVEYTQRMHSDLAKATTLRGYVQIDPVATDALAGITGNNGISPAGSKRIALTQLDGTTPVLISRPSTRPAAVNGFEQVQAVAVDKPSYLGPTILAAHGTPTRVKFYNGLPAGHGFADANGWHRQGDLFIPVDHTLFGGGDGQTQTGVKDILCGDVLAGPNNPGDPAFSACGPTALHPGGGYVTVPAFAQYTENREELHLHGGDNPWISDGHPHQWITPAADELDPTTIQNYKRGDIAYNVPDMPNPGPGAVTYFWPNGQSGRLLFYHDHATGLTRLNVYAGTAAGYLLIDNNERGINSLVATEIPLVIQEKTFVPKDIATEDAKWDTTRWGQEGDLWFPHVYETNQDPLAADATNPVGRWDGASFFWPVFPQTYATPSGEYGNVSTTPESFMDTPIVNGMAYPTMTVNPAPYRFRILGLGNDRMLNLSLFVADPTQVSASGVANTEVKMVPFASPNGPTAVTYSCPDGVTAGQIPGNTNANGLVVKAGWTETSVYYPTSFPCAGGLTDTGWGSADNRPGGVPDPATIGPDIVRIGNEGGLFQQPVIIPATTINYEYNKRSVTVLNVLERSLWLGPAERADVIIDFSNYAGKTLILYNDSGAPVPAGDPRIDYYTGDGDQTGAGGAPTTVAGYGPNTRTIMQINVSAGTPAPLNLAALNTQLLAAYVATQPKPVVPTPEYAPMGGVLGFTTTAPYEHIFTGAIYLNKYNALTIPAAADAFNYTPAPVCSTTATCLTALTNLRKGVNGGLVQSTPGLPVKAYVESKAIQELFENDYGRMNATLGVELPFTNVTIQTTIPLAYVDPATETIANGETQFWKITHNGVDSHPVHFHFINVQVINRVGWDGTIKPIPADEVGWKETVKMHPLEDIIVAVRAKTSPPTPFGMPHSYRQPAPNQLPSDNHGITQIDAATGNAPRTPYTNAPV
ncbi:MAG: multicopper oxidase domain-containing protein, partial [Proteobacteria bacterium]|nr:multicopper oxidase domain-containing protein [Pseudomonadota bacterium]